LPPSVFDFDCWAVNVAGDGIPASHPAIFAFDGPSIADSSCVYPGVTSALFPPVPPGESVTIELEVPVGARRMVQMLGVQSYVGCPGFPAFGEVLASEIDPATFEIFSFGEVSLLGSSVADTFGDTEVEIFNSYDPYSGQHPFCAQYWGIPPESIPGPGIAPYELSGLWAWYDALTIGAGDGALISYWPDSSGFGNDLFNPGGGAEPVYRYGLLSYPVLEFDGADYLERAAPNGMPLGETPFTVAAVVYADPSSGGQIVSFGNFFEPYRGVELFATSYGSYMMAVPGGGSVASTTQPGGSWDVVVGVHLLKPEESRWQIYVDGVFEADWGFSPGLMNLDPYELTLGSSGALATPLVGMIAEVALFDRDLTYDEIQGLTQHFSEKYGVLTAPVPALDPGCDPAMPSYPGGLWGWYEAESIGATHLSALAFWPDLSPAGNHLTNESGPASPT